MAIQTCDVFWGIMDQLKRVLKRKTMGRAELDALSGEICVFSENGDVEEPFLLLVPEKEPWSKHDYWVSMMKKDGSTVATKIGYANVLTGINSGLVQIDIPKAGLSHIFVNLSPQTLSKQEELAA